jgi:hypothetical protein
MDWLTIKNLRDETKIQAWAQLQANSASIGEAMSVFEKDCVKNKVTISVNSPTLVIPFKQSDQQQIDNSNCWVFIIPQLEFIDKTSSVDNDAERFHCFQLDVKDVAFIYCNSYKEWTVDSSI